MTKTNLFDEPLLKAKMAAEDVQKRFPDDLTKYNANLWLRLMIEECDIELIECHFKNDMVLGHSMIDDLGASIMVNDSIQDRNRKNFTIAHEFGHHIMHENILKNTSLYDLGNDLVNQDLISPLEAQANVYAANLLLPYKVLEAQIVTGCSAYEIKHLAGISIDAIKYRVQDFLMHFFYLDAPTAIYIANDFICSYTRNTAYNTVLKDLIDNSYPVTYLLPGITSVQTYEKNQRILPKILQMRNVYDKLTDDDKRKVSWHAS